MHPQHTLSRRDALKALATGTAVITLGATAGRAQGKMAATPAPFELPKLGYAYDALEPHIDARTMEIHHSKHHQAYITNANNALKSHAALQGKSGEAMMKDLNALPANVRTTLRNNVGGHLNHAFFWQTIGPKAGGAPRGELAEEITKSFGSFDKFKTAFASQATGRFGSGWAWLNLKDGKLVVTSTGNQDTPLSSGAVPLLGLDVWEHAYYLQYQNRRADYVTAFWNVVNWDKVTANYRAAKG